MRRRQAPIHQFTVYVRFFYPSAALVSTLCPHPAAAPRDIPARDAPRDCARGARPPRRRAHGPLRPHERRWQEGCGSKCFKTKIDLRQKKPTTRSELRNKKTLQLSASEGEYLLYFPPSRDNQVYIAVCNSKNPPISSKSI